MDVNIISDGEDCKIQIGTLNNKVLIRFLKTLLICI